MTLNCKNQFCNDITDCFGMGETEWSMVMSAAALSYRPKRIGYNQSKARKRQCCQYHHWVLSFFGAEIIWQKQKEEDSGLKIARNGWCVY